MPERATISRLGSNEFLAVMAPGVFIVATVAFGAAAIAESLGPALPGDPLRILEDADIIANPSWLVGVVLLLIAYLVGNIPRAIPVKRADDACECLFSLFAKRGWHKKLYERGFPYQPAIDWKVLGVPETARNAVLDYESHGGNSILPESDSGDGLASTYPHTRFNYWKAVLCERSPGAFAVAQSHEATSHLFAGMMWAGVAGLSISGTVMLCLVRHTVWAVFASVGLVAVLIGLLMVSIAMRRRRASARTGSGNGDCLSAIASWTTLTGGVFLLAVAIVSSCCWIVTSGDAIGRWLLLNTIIMVTSALMTAAFGSHLRRVRGREVDAVLLAFIALRERLTEDRKVDSASMKGQNEGREEKGYKTAVKKKAGRKRRGRSN